MAEHKVRESDGWTGIAKALSLASHGDDIILGPGQYIGNETLSIPTGATLTGCAEAQLVYTGDSTAIRVDNANDVIIRQIRLRAYRHQSSINYEEGIEERPGLLDLKYSKNVKVQECEIYTHAHVCASICAVHSGDIQILYNTIRGGGIGVSFLSSSGKISNNIVSDGLVGILLSIHLCHLLRPSDAIIENNRLLDNGHIGIGLAASYSENIYRNFCLGGLAGIQLQMHADKLDTVSVASIVENHCVAQVNAGIVLQSSFCHSIEGNVCQGSQRHGIVLGTDPRLSGSRSVAARISGNMCHDNAASGIWLGSAHCEIIASNRCWANGESGIHLARDLSEAEAPARAEIRDNILQGNGGAGISLQGSESDGIINNACFRNRGCGIDVVASAEAHNAPSHAKVCDNRLQSNSGKAIHFIGSSGEAKNNRSRDNTTNGVTIQSAPFAVRSWALSLVPAVPQLSGNVTDAQLDLSVLLLPELRTALHALGNDKTSHGHNEEGLARFLATGSAGSFRAFWTGHEHASDPVNALEQVSAKRRWRLCSVGEDISLEARPQRLETLKDELLRQIDRALQGNDGTEAQRAHWFAVVIPDDRDGIQIRQNLDARDNRKTGGYVPPGTRRSPPLVIDQGIGETPLRDALNNALMQGRSRALTRAVELGRLAIWPALIALLVIAGSGQTQWGQSMAASIVPEGMWERVLLALTIVAAATASVSIIDLLMPTHLRAGTRPRDQDNALEEIVQALGGTAAALVRATGKLIPQGRRDNWAKWADLRWQRRHMFHEADISSLYLADAAGWHPTDVEWLNLHVAALGSMERLVTLIELDGRLSIRPMLVDVEDAPWTQAVDIFLFDDEESLRLSSVQITDINVDAPDVSGLLRANDTVEVQNELVDDRWTPTDMLPTLPIASAPTLRARISRLKTDNRDLLDGEALVALVYPAAKGLFTTDERPLLLDAAAIKRPFELSDQVRALRRYSALVGRQHFEHLAGRAGYRRDIANSLHKLWPDENDWQEYVASALRFGIWHGLVQARSFVERFDSPYATLGARRALEAVSFLGRDLADILTDDVRLHGEADVYQPAWEGLTSAIKTLPSSKRCSQLIRAFLAAQAQCNQTDAALLRSIVDDVEASLLDPLKKGEREPVTAVEAFSQGEAQRIMQMADLDPAARPAAIARAKATAWCNLPEAMLVQFENWANGLGANTRSLSILFASAKNAAQIDQLIIMHAHLAERTIFALANAATNHLIYCGGGMEPDPKDPLLVACAHTMFNLRQTWQNNGRQIALASSFASGAAGVPMPAIAAADYFAAAEAAERIYNLLTPTAAEMLSALEGQLELAIMT